MRVSVSQLKPGYVLINNIIGKSGRTLMPKNTVLTEEYIQILNKFLIETVDISTKPLKSEKSNNTYDMLDKESMLEEIDEDKTEDKTPLVAHFLEVVEAYKQQFKKWQNNFSIDMPTLRNIFIPLIDHFEDRKINIYTLSKYAKPSDYIYFHSVSLGLMSAYIAQKMNLEKREWVQAGLAGLLSDCGLAKVDEKIMNKRPPLNKKEIEAIQEHPRQSYYLVESIPTISKAIKLAILQHHERFDGSGYPIGLKGNRVHLYARIIAVCDMYYTKVTNPTTGKVSPFKAIKEIQQAQYNELDPRIVHRFIREFTKSTLGLRVRLSNQKIGKIIFINEEKPDQPIVKLENGQEIISLENEDELFVSEII